MKKSSKDEADKMEKVISLAKRRGFIFSGSEIYGGFSGMWDYGPFGVTLKENIKRLWWRMFVEERDDIYGLDSAILMRSDVWRTSGHTENFADPLVEDLKTGKRFRADHLLENAGFEASKMNIEEMNSAIADNDIKSPDNNNLSEVKSFNMMFETSIGAVFSEENKSYLRPETAQGIFANFKNVYDSMHPKLPFGIAQIGKAFRNEISPRDFIFRAREFEQMEIEYFVRESEWKEHFENFRKEMWRWIKALGLSEDAVHELEVPEEDRAHYSKRTIDFEFDYPFGRKELYGLAYRTDYDLKKHSEASGVDLEYIDQEGNERFIPHIIEPSLGVDRTILAVLLNGYKEDDLGGEKRVFLSLPASIAPVRVAVFPLVKNKPEITDKAKEIYKMIKNKYPNTYYDEGGSIGKRYRRQDEIGTPHCVTVDFETLEDGAVTVRNRDSGEQERVKIEELENYFKNNE